MNSAATTFAFARYTLSRRSPFGAALKAYLAGEAHRYWRFDFHPHIKKLNLMHHS